jgi:hypothetical protein
VTVDDPEVKPLLAAMKEVDRAALGFTPIEGTAKMRLQSQRRGYDGKLHIYGKTSHTIAFRRAPEGYQWIHEQETHEGPRWEQTVEGVFRESVTLRHETERASGTQTNALRIFYSGPDSALSGRELTLAEVRPVLERWKDAPVEPKPPDTSGFQVPEPFLPMMAVLALLGCVLALMAGVVASLLLLLLVGLLAGLIAAGVVSASVVIGVLRRSVSTGFRALFFQIGGGLGLILGSLGAWVFILLAKLPMDSVQPWVIGPLLGLLFGLLAAWMFNFAWGRSVEWIARKLPGKKVVEVEGEEV